MPQIKRRLKESWLGGRELELNCGVVAKLKDTRHARLVRGNLGSLATTTTPRDIRHATTVFNACANARADVLIEHHRRNVPADMTKVRHRRSQRVRLINLERALVRNALVNFLVTSTSETPDWRKWTKCSCLIDCIVVVAALCNAGTRSIVVGVRCARLNGRSRAQLTNTLLAHLALAASAAVL